MDRRSDSDDRHCLELVRTVDRDRFLASLFLPEALRPHVLALYAFSHEIARTRETVSDPQLGAIRHQWWREALDGIWNGAPPDHPVARSLAGAVVKGELPKQPFVNLIEARAFDLYNDPMPTVNDLEGYLGETSSILIQLAARILAEREADAAAEAAGNAGVAYGLTGLLRALPLHRARGQCYLPKDGLARHGLTPAGLMAGEDREALGNALADLRGLARRRLAEARKALQRVPRAARPAFLPLAVVEGYLKRLDRLGPAALVQTAETSQVRRQISLFRHSLTGTF
jgi:phytoene synthase